MTFSTPNITTFQATAEQYCSKGYDVAGNGTIRCLSTGNWSVSITCMIKGRSVILGITFQFGCLRFNRKTETFYLSRIAIFKLLIYALLIMLFNTCMIVHRRVKTLKGKEQKNINGFCLKVFGKLHCMKIGFLFFKILRFYIFKMAANGVCHFEININTGNH